MRNLLIIILFSILLNTNLNGQNPHQFDNEISIFSKIPIVKGEDLAVFTGSSSIRLWKNLETDCNRMNVVNTGFGGSQMSDLLYFLNETVLRFKPAKVYIYEGDNDITANKEPKEILETAKLITNKILASNSNTKIYFISAKPSLARWMFKEEYEAFNSLLKNYCQNQRQVSYIDVWNPMLNKNGRVKSYIFTQDSLHMNRKGYLIWKEVMSNNSE